MRIFDCILYAGEIELLLLRLHELFDDVDVFVIVESVKSFRGETKPLLLRTLWAKIRPFARKIRYVVVDDDIAFDNEKDRKIAQRNACQRGLLDANDADLICVADVGEIPNATTIRSLRNDTADVFRFNLSNFRFHGNVHDTQNTPAEPASAFRKQVLDRYTPSEVRYGIGSGLIDAKQIDDAGWRYSRASSNTSNTVSRPEECTSNAKLAPMVICPYVYDEDRLQVIAAFELDDSAAQHFPIYFWKDEHLIGPERAYAHCWNQFPDRDVIIIHTDMRPMPDDKQNNWYDALCTKAEQLPDAGLIGCDLLYPLRSPSGHWYAQCAGGYFKDGRVTHFGGGVSLADNSATAAAYEYDDRFAKVRKSPWVTFGGVYIRRETIDMIGDFDTRYLWAYVMDVDYCLEATIRGQRIYQVPVNLLHEESTTSKKFLGQPEYLAKAEGNMRKFLEKWDWYLSRLGDN